MSYGKPFTKEPCTSAKEPYISATEPYTSAKEPHISVSGTWQKYGAYTFPFKGLLQISL